MTKTDANRILKAAEHLLKAEDALCSIKNNLVYNAVTDEIESVATPKEIRAAAEMLISFVKSHFNMTA